MLICSQMRNSTLKEERRSNETKAKPMKCEESSKISYEICMKVRKAGNLVDRAGWLLNVLFYLMMSLLALPLLASLTACTVWCIILIVCILFVLLCMLSSQAFSPCLLAFPCSGLECSLALYCFKGLL